MDILSTLSGRANSIRATSNITVNTTVSEITGTTSQSVVREKMNFRIDNHPVFIGMTINVNDGDEVSAVGLQKGEFENPLTKQSHHESLLYGGKTPSYRRDSDRF